MKTTFCFPSLYFAVAQVESVSYQVNSNSKIQRLPLPKYSIELAVQENCHTGVF